MWNTIKQYMANSFTGLFGIRVTQVLVLFGLCLGGGVCAQESSSAFDKSKVKPIEKTTPSTKRDIYQISDVLTDGQFHTVVPKGCILSLPESLSNRLASGPTGSFEFWPDFYARNKSWIRVQDLEADVVRGKAPLPETVVKMMGTETRMVIASYKGNLTTVLEAPAKEGAVDESGKKKEKK